MRRSRRSSSVNYSESLNFGGAAHFGYGYESFPGLPGAPLAACTQATAPLQAQSWGGGWGVLQPIHARGPAGPRGLPLVYNLSVHVVAVCKRRLPDVDGGSLMT